jgi:hypothetical protein
MYKKIYQNEICKDKILAFRGILQAPNSFVSIVFWMLAIIHGQLVIAFFVSTFCPFSIKTPEGIGLLAIPDTALIVSVLILAPLIESVVLVLTLRFFFWMFSTVWVTVLVSGFCMAMLHAFDQGLGRGAITFWSFSLYSFAYFQLIKADSKNKFWILVLLHFLNNVAALTPSLLLM